MKFDIQEIVMDTKNWLTSLFTCNEDEINMKVPKKMEPKPSDDFPKKEIIVKEPIKVAPKSQRKTRKPGKPNIHLTQNNVRGVELIIMGPSKTFKDAYKLIKAQYNISHQTATRIKKGTHKYSTPGFKAKY